MKSVSEIAQHGTGAKTSAAPILQRGGRAGGFAGGDSAAYTDEPAPSSAPAAPGSLKQIGEGTLTQPPLKIYCSKKNELDAAALKKAPPWLREFIRNNPDCTTIHDVVEKLDELYEELHGHKKHPINGEEHDGSEIAAKGRGQHEGTVAANVTKPKTEQQYKQEQSPHLTAEMNGPRGPSNGMMG